MVESWVKTLNISYNPSGAAAAAGRGHIVMIIDVIDMSTTAETALECGVKDIYGASPDNADVPVPVDPEKIGYDAGLKALRNDTGIVIAAEPRIEVGSNNCRSVVRGVHKAGNVVEAIIPNLGKEIGDFTELEERILIIVSAAGGAAYDAAYTGGATGVFTGTVARTPGLKGDSPATRACRRVIDAARKNKCGISLVAASSNSREDTLAAAYIGQKIIDRGFLQLK